MAEKDRVQQLEEKLRKRVGNTWRLADSDKWKYLKGTNLLSFDYLNPEIDYQKVDFDDRNLEQASSEKELNQTDLIRKLIREDSKRIDIERSLVENFHSGYSEKKSKKWARNRFKGYERAYGEMGILDPEIDESMSVKTWINDLSIGDLVFLMDKHTYYGVAQVLSTYHNEGPFIDMGGSIERPAIEVEYIDKQDKPISHKLSKSHRQPRTFAGIGQYDFGLTGVLAFLNEEVPEAVEALEQFLNRKQGNEVQAVVNQLKQFKNKENVLLFAQMVRKLYDYLGEPENSDRIVLTVPQNKNRFTVNLNNRLYLSLRNKDGQDEFLVTLDKVDYDKSQEFDEFKGHIELLPEDRSAFSGDEDFANTLITVIQADFLKEHLKQITHWWLKSADGNYDSMQKSPYLKHHQPFLHKLVYDEHRLNYYFDQSNSFDVINQVAHTLLQSVESVFPGFKGFTDPRFIEQEITYKERIISEAQEQLSSETIRKLLQKKDYEALYYKVLNIGRHKDNNLLYKGTPRTGDLALLHDEDLDYESFAKAIAHPLHPNIEGSDKIDRFSYSAKDQDWPNKWTFVTYFMFVTNPNEELFVKPTEMKEFLELLGKGDLWNHRPTGELYQIIKYDLRAVGDALPFEVKRGFLDLQSFLWVALSKEAKNNKKGSKAMKAFTWVPVHKELAQKLLDYENRQQELLEILKDVGISGFTDRAEEGEIELDEIDPFTFFRYIHKHGDENRLKYLREIAEKFNISPLPEDVFGMPTANPTTARLFPFKRDRNDEVEKLWSFFESVVSNDISSSEWENMKTQPGIAIPTLTHVLFYIKPDKYLPVDQHTKPYLKEVLNIDTEVNSFEDYEKLLANVRERTTKPFYEISKAAFDWHTRDVNYWWLNANPDIWSLTDTELGQEQWYSSYNKEGNKRQIYKNFQEVKTGDLIIGYESTPVKQIKAILEVTEPLHTDDEEVEKFTFRLKQFTPNQPRWDELKALPELADCGVLNNNQGSLFSISKEEFQIIHDLAFKQAEDYESYSMHDALNEVFMEKEELQNILDLLDYKKNIILQGPPGTGKTFLAKRLAWLLMEAKDSSRVEMVQFHPSYSYEDFIRGYRPTEKHFKLKDGIFMKMCNKAKSDPDSNYFLIIDEVNRGNLGKIFGELMMLIEKDKRGEDFTVQLPYQSEDEPDFYIPENLHLIGTMNTADRSLAMVDYALRRRFVFIDMMPKFGSKFRAHLKEEGVEDHLVNTIVERLNNLNITISEETGLGEGFQIGHSYFCHTDGSDENWFKNVVRYEIVPLLKEYWFDKPKRVEEIEEELVTL